MNFAGCFPGQGSQSVGMLAELASEYPLVKETFSIASRSISVDLFSLITEGPAQKLNLTFNTQPAILVASVACYRIWKGLGGATPMRLAGHSLGEYSALVCAESLTLEDATRLVTLRGILMQQAVPEGLGKMAAIIGLEDEQIVSLCRTVAEESQHVVSAANFNCPGQVVISGHAEAVEQTCRDAEAAGARLTSILPVSVPSHCILMQDAATELAKALENTAVSSPKISIIHNVDTKSYSHPDDIRQALVSQLTSPVRWVDTINLMCEESIETFIEFGPGRVLTGMNKRINRKGTHIALNEPGTFTSLIAKMRENA